MKNTLFQDFQDIIDNSRRAFKYGEEHFDELMSRPVSHILYGPEVQGPGAGQPSQRLVPCKDRVLKDKTRRERFRAYYFDSNWDLLYSRCFRQKEKIESTVLHFWLGDTNYARWFFQDRNAFYKAEVYSSQYQNGKPTRFDIAHDHRVYVEYFKEIPSDGGDLLTSCNWFDYYPTREVATDGTLLSKDAPFGASNSPVKIGQDIFKAIDTDFRHWDNAGYPLWRNN